MTHILSNLPKAYEIIVENIEDELYDNVSPLTIKNIHEYLSVKYNQINVRPEKKNPRGYEKPLYVRTQCKGTFTISGKYRQKIK